MDLFETKFFFKICNFKKGENPIYQAILDTLLPI